MRRISLWAKLHPASARVFVIAIKLLLLFMAWSVGNSLLKLGITIPVLAGQITIVLFIFTVCLYPSRSAGKKAYHYLKQKTCDFLLAMFTFIIVVAMVDNNFNLSSASVASVQPTYHDSKHPPTAQEILSSLKYRDKSTLTMQEKRILKKEFKKQVKVYVKAKLAGDNDKGKEALLIILTIIAAIGLFILVASLSCSISCGGADGLALIVLLVGLAAIIYGSAVLITRIKRGPKNKKPVKTNPGKTAFNAP